jgi:hypothetical protein
LQFRTRYRAYETHRAISFIVGRFPYMSNPTRYIRDASQSAATQPIARNARLAAISNGGTPVTAIRIGMMIGDEIGTSDSTRAVVPVGFNSTG